LVRTQPDSPKIHTATQKACYIKTQMQVRFLPPPQYGGVV
jgi:hypothetical protein